MENFETIGAGLCREVHAPAHGRQDLGHSPGGPIDRFSVQTGNIMLGSPDFACAVEIVYAPVLEFKQDCLFVLTGAPCRNAVLQHGPDPTTSVALRHNTIESAQKGDWIVLGKPEYGLRSYICFAARDTVADADSAVGRSRAAYEDVHTFGDADGRIRLTRGPEYDLLDEPKRFLNQAWTTTCGMSDMGVRLICPGADWPDLQQGNMVSGPVNDGTVQLTPTGPIILLRQRATIGGYPRIFNVIDADVDVLGQYGPNQVLHFRELTVEEAVRIAAGREQALEQFRADWAREG